MGASLKTVDAVVDADGTVRLRQPIRLSGPTSAVVTLLVRDDEPNEVTRQAIDEPIAELPRFESVNALFQELELKRPQANAVDHSQKSVQARL